MCQPWSEIRNLFMYWMVELLFIGLNGQKRQHTKILREYICLLRARTLWTYSCVIFDGYKQGPSIKDHEHQRRLGKACADIQVREFMEAHPNQQMFLSNEGNKCQFISLLHQYLESDGQIVHTMQ